MAKQIPYDVYDTIRPLWYEVKVPAACDIAVTIVSISSSNSNFHLIKFFIFKSQNFLTLLISCLQTHTPLNNLVLREVEF